MKYLILISFLLFLGCPIIQEFTEIEIEGYVLLEDSITTINNAKVVLGYKHSPFLGPEIFEVMKETFTDSLGYYKIIYNDSLNTDSRINLKVIPNQFLFDETVEIYLSPEIYVPIVLHEHSFKIIYINANDTVFVDKWNYRERFEKECIPRASLDSVLNSSMLDNWGKNSISNCIDSIPKIWDQDSIIKRFKECNTTLQETMEQRLKICDELID